MPWRWSAHWHLCDVAPHLLCSTVSSYCSDMKNGDAKQLLAVSDDPSGTAKIGSRHVSFEDVAQQIKEFEKRNPSVAVSLTGRMKKKGEPVETSASPKRNSTITITLPLTALKDSEFLRVVQRYSR